MPFYKKQHSDHAFYREDQLGIPFIFRPLFAEIINPRSSPFGWERGFDFVCYFPVNALEILCTALCPVSSLSMQMHTLQMHGLSFKFTTTPYLTHRRRKHIHRLVSYRESDAPGDGRGWHRAHPPAYP